MSTSFDRLLKLHNELTESIERDEIQERREKRRLRRIEQARKDYRQDQLMLTIWVLSWGFGIIAVLVGLSFFLNSGLFLAVIDWLTVLVVGNLPIIIAVTVAFLGIGIAKRFIKEIAS